jgi:pimeloyl-ACP methyl ester carboxylesterase
MKKLLLTKLLIFSFLLHSNAQNYTESILDIPTSKDSIYGTLMSPKDIENLPLVILISGSGANDRDGNQGNIRNNSLLYLAQGLSNKGIATYRYDKPVLSMYKKGTFKESEFTFSILIEAAKEVGAYFKKQKNYSKIYVAGHSQGSLVGMIAASSFAGGFISLAGAGETFDIIIKEQLHKQVPMLDESIASTLTKLKNGKTDPDFNPMLVNIFRLSVQPFLIDWIQYNPQIEINKLVIPILIINGTNDMQIAVNEAKLLHKAAPKSELVFIENMNHIFKEIKGDVMENQLSYSNPDLPIMNELIDIIYQFVNSKKN